MTQLSATQIRSYAQGAGFKGNDLNTAVAIALAESGGNPMAYNPELGANTAKGSGSRGLWQIYGAAHPQYNSDLMFDPAANAAAAFAVYKEAGNKFTPWSTYNNGSYAQTSSPALATTAPKSSQGPTALQTQAAPASSLIDVQLLPQNILDALQSPTLKIDLILGGLGVLLIVIGFALLFGVALGGAGQKYSEIQREATIKAVKTAAPELAARSAAKSKAAANKPQTPREMWKARGGKFKE